MFFSGNTVENIDLAPAMLQACGRKDPVSCDVNLLSKLWGLQENT